MTSMLPALQSALDRALKNTGWPVTKLLDGITTGPNYRTDEELAAELRRVYDPTIAQLVAQPDKTFWIHAVQIKDDELSTRSIDLSMLLLKESVVDIGIKSFFGGTIAPIIHGAPIDFPAGVGLGISRKKNTLPKPIKLDPTVRYYDIIATIQTPQSIPADFSWALKLSESEDPDSDCSQMVYGTFNRGGRIHG